jgi:hypothetical protein
MAGHLFTSESVTEGHPDKIADCWSTRPASSRFDDLVEAGSMQRAKEAGRVRMEGKDYVMHDGDVVEFRFNVRPSRVRRITTP